METRLDGVRIKLARAVRHVGELKGMLGSVADDAAASIEGRPSDATHSVLEYRVKHVPALDPMVPAVIGDIVHNLRSALDHLAWQLVVLDGGTPNLDTKFPLLYRRTNKSGQLVPVDIKPGISNARIRAALEWMQPYVEADHGHDALTDAMGIVQRLDNIDKHRLLLTVVHRIDLDLPAYWGSSEGDPEPTCRFNTGPLQSGDLVATFDFGGASPPAQFDPHLNLAVTVDEPEASWVRGRSVVDAMLGLAQSLALDINLHFLELFDEPPVVAG